MLTMMRRLRSEQRGATAIEYAIIAGLIGLGLVGSLVTTRGSLSGIFGTASSAMGSSSAADPNAGTANPSNPGSRAPFWNAKTLASAPTKSTSNGVTTTSYVYTDGTSVQYAVGGSNPQANKLSVFDPANSIKYFYFTDSTGNGSYFSQKRLNEYGQIVNDTFTSVAVYNDTFTGSTPSIERYFEYTYPNTSSQQVTSHTEIYRNPTVQYKADAVSGSLDFSYFADLSK